MARKTKELKLNDRGTEKTFRITEMPASKFEWWLIRAGKILLGTGLGNSVDVDSAEDVQQINRADAVQRRTQEPGRS